MLIGDFRMSEYPISEVITSALAEALGKSGSMLTGFVAVAESINADGEHQLVVTHTPSQSTHLNLGLLAYATEWYRDDVRFQINQLCEEDE